MKRACIGLLFLLVALTTGAADLPVRPPKESFLLVHTRWTSNGVTVVRAERVPGRLKPKRPSRGTLEVRLADAQGKPLWASPMEDPRQQRFEYPDEPETGGMRHLEATLSTADVMIRVPVTPGASELQLLGAKPASSVSPATLPPDGQVSEPTRPVLVRIALTNDGAAVGAQSPKSP